MARRIGATHRDRLLLGAVIVGAALLFWCAAQAAGDPPAFLVGLFVLALAAVTVNPHTATGAGLLLVSVWLWYVAVDDSTTWWSLVAGCALLTVHSAQSLLASGPDPAPVPTTIARTWLRRTLAVAGVTLATGALTLTLHGRSSTSTTATIIGLAVVAAAVVAVLIAARDQGDEAH
ncbi:hypothetical protein VV01_05565 [Luteipulveratus halotolerans]|uniref:Uncharacterized protein n=1 Tax=Luteipulveratus halotolerans TaxID=1631356 RepID=A0A0L6CG02_9MICO|nr:hypothetical protein VV01_05565 [Luteipulveratus halotolerans]